MRPTALDVARAAGVSVATVSNALNDTGRASAATRTRVREVAASMGYRPNAAGRTLRTGRTGVLALAVTTFGEQTWNFAEVAYYAQMVAAATSAAHAHGYALTVLPASLDVDGWHAVSADGVVLLDSPEGDPAAEVLRARGIPIAFDGQPHQLGPRDSWVDNDHAATMAKVLGHLREQGARRIALLAQNTSDHYTRDCVAAYRAQVRTPRIALLDSTDPVGRAEAERLLREGADAVYGLLDDSGRGVLAAADALGLRVPDDVLVVTASEDPTYASTSPPISTVSLRPADTITAAVDALAATLAGAPPTVRADLATDLVVRASSTRRPSAGRGGRLRS
ncbi:LacI family DNA-binding transcriptional regulator [Nocardioides sp. SLBN-35]|uniref:LacI family DNA-binding transcriptional regulator n=1 Tax=Nocardioides sp. SLBN-35 TaxID=2768445 RepID=UPI00114FF8C6|nr:LacI family DNA-binding transcriptional regulator [Nocardioides sp. SLBN-35]TQK69104.1 DNA-binding LacI/PurR family transcriptional regulator [Nocardioides sp. SLBN-35]